jgi:hypothetical protein
MSDVNVLSKRAVTIFSDGNNNYFLSLYGFLRPQFGNLLFTLCECGFYETYKIILYSFHLKLFYLLLYYLGET